MEPQPPPLTPEEMSHYTGLEYARLGHPQQVKIFGVMHVVFGSMGILMILWTLSSFIGKDFSNEYYTSPSKTQEDTKLINQLIAYVIVSGVLFIVVTALIFKAGILLLKGRRNAIKWSNYYAWASIVSKIINLIAILIIVLPLINKMMQDMSTSTGTMLGTIKVILIVLMILFYVLPLIYPVLSLILLNRPYVKTWFSNQPV